MKKQDPNAALAEARSALEAVIAGESAAATTPASYGEWRAKRDAAAAEVDRLDMVARIVEADRVEAERRTAEAEARKRHAAAKAASDALAKRVTEFGAKLAADVRKLMGDLAANEIEIEAVNGKLPAGLEALATADEIARRAPAVPEEIVSEKTFTAWVLRGTEKPLSDQRIVADEFGRAQIRLGHLFKAREVERRTFRLVKKRRARRAEYAPPLWQSLVIPSFDRASPPIWDGPSIGGAWHAVEIAQAPRQTSDEAVRDEFFETVELVTTAEPATT